MARVAIAHDYLTQRGGAERVVLAMQRAFPDATIYTTLYNPDGTYPEFRDANIVTSALNRFKVFRRDHRMALPFLAAATRTLQIDADVVVVSSSGWAHGFPTTGARVVYCYSPARWLYQTETYLGGPAWRSPRGLALLTLSPFLKRWDKRKAQAAERYLAISNVVRERISAAYGIESDVVPAPHSFSADRPQAPIEDMADWDDYYLVVSRLLPYKNVTEVVSAFRNLDERLVIIGDGPLRDQIVQSLPDNVRLFSGVSDEQMCWAYANSRAIIAPSIEDYGLTPLEGGVYGKPTLALRAGGYLDTIAEGLSGTFFDSPTASEIAKAVRADRRDWAVDQIAAHVDQFSEPYFIERLQREVAALS